MIRAGGKEMAPVRGKGHGADCPKVVEGWSKKTAENVPLQEGTMPNPPVEGTIDMGGGLPVMLGSEVIGAIAVSGAPSWPMDEACAKAGLAKVADKLK